MGLNFGIDFRGGILIEVRTPEAADLQEMRANLGQLGLGEVTLQEFGDPQEVLIRVQRQEGDEEQQIQALLRSRARWAVPLDIPPNRVCRADRRAGADRGRHPGRGFGDGGHPRLYLVPVRMAVRFVRRCGIAARRALDHRRLALIQHEFNLATVAALLTIAGYSINDTVVVFDRTRENLRRYKKATLIEVLNRSLNETLSRTLMTSLTTLLALASLYILGGSIIRDFAFALIWGVLIGTYSSIFVAVPLLISLNIRRPPAKAPATGKAEATMPPQGQ